MHSNLPKYYLLIFSAFPSGFVPPLSPVSLSPCSLDGLHFLLKLKPLLPVHQEERISCTSLRPEALLFLPHTQHPIVWLYLGPKSILNWFPSWQICVFHLVLGPGFDLNILNNFLFFQGEVLLHADNLYMTRENEKIKGWLKTCQMLVFANNPGFDRGGSSDKPSCWEWMGWHWPPGEKWLNYALAGVWRQFFFADR